ncbi:MAG: lysophospholipase L1-like esterase [Phycisphaerales bacterium]|jgi:lysophospholipase L1-like esterase
MKNRQIRDFVSVARAACMLVLLVAGCQSTHTSADTQADTQVGQTDPVATPSQAPNPCVIPVSSGETRGTAAGWGEGFTWMDQHDAINVSSARAVAEGRRVDVVLLGDSITQSWGGPGRRLGSPGAAAREQHFGRWDTLNFGISGDRTQHLLWRIEHGNFDGISPQAIVLMIGTNNLSAGDSIEQIAAGVAAILDSLTHRLPETQIVLCGVLPRGRLPTDPMRLAVEQLNALLGPLGDRPRVEFVDHAPGFLDGNGEARGELMAGDFLHLRPAGYDAWGAALAAELQRLFPGGG